MGARQRGNNRKERLTEVKDEKKVKGRNEGIHEEGREGLKGRGTQGWKSGKKSQ